MKKCMIILTSGVTIEIKTGDKVEIGRIDGGVEKVTKLEMIPLMLHWSNSKDVIINYVKHKAEKVNVEYYIPSDKISWVYVQEVKNEQTGTKGKA